MKGLLKNTAWHRKYWKKRVINWHDSYWTPEHPHRDRIIEALQQFHPFRSVLEVGCAAGANLYRVKQAFPQSDVGGMDWSADAIAEAKKIMPKVSVLQVGEATDIYIGSQGTDILLSDMCYIYLSKRDFRKAMKEAKRAVRLGVVFCEFHEKSAIKRFLIRLVTGYNAYDYRAELLKAGFHDVQIKSLTTKDWPDTEKENGLRAVISARA